MMPNQRTIFKGGAITARDRGLGDRFFLFETRGEDLEYAGMDKHDLVALLYNRRLCATTGGISQ